MTKYYPNLKTPHQTFRLCSLTFFFTFVPSSLLHLRSFFTSSPFVSPFHIVFTLFTSSLLHCSFHRLFHHSFFTDRFSRELVEAFIAPFSSLSRTVHLWVSQLQIVLPLLYVLFVLPHILPRNNFHFSHCSFRPFTSKFWNSS